MVLLHSENALDAFAKQALEHAAAGQKSGAFIASDPNFFVNGSWQVVQTLNQVNYIISAQWDKVAPDHVTLYNIQHTILDDTTWKPWLYEPIPGQKGYIFPDWYGMALTAGAIVYYGEQAALFQQFGTVIQWASPPLSYEMVDGKLKPIKPKAWPCQ